MIREDAAAGTRISYNVTITRTNDGNLTALTEGAKEAAAYPATAAVIFRNQQKNSQAVSDSIAITKQLCRVVYTSGSGDKDTTITAPEDMTFYAALFSDEARTKRVSEVVRISILKGKSSGSATIGQVAKGTYYVGETDETGTLIGTASDAAGFYATYVAENKDSYKVEAANNTGKAKTHAVTIRNHYYTLVIRKQVLHDGQVLNPQESKTFYFMLYTDAQKQTPVEGMETIITKTDENGREKEETERHPLALAFGTSSTSAVLYAAGIQSGKLTGLKPGTYYIQETDSTGTAIGSESALRPE